MTQTLGPYITNEQTATFAVNNAGLVNAKPVLVTMGTIEAPVTAADDTIILCALPTDSKLIEVSLAFDDLEAQEVAPDSTMHLGLFRQSAPGVFTVVDADILAASIDVFTAAVALTNYRFSAQNINTAQMPTWDLALSARPAYNQMYLGLTTAVSTLGTDIGTISFRVLYTL